MEEFLEKMTSCGELIQYICCDNSGEHQSSFTEGVRKIKGYVGIHQTAHAPSEWSYRKTTFYYQGKSISNAVKRKTQ